MSRAVSPAARRRDLIALALVLAGTVAFGAASLGLREMAQGRGVVRGASTSYENLAKADRLLSLSRAGAGLIALGVAAGIWSFVRHVSSLRSREHGQEDRS